VELQTGTPFECAEFQFCSQGSKMLLQTLPSVINLFPEHSFYEKINFRQKWSCKQEPPLSVQNLFGMHLFTLLHYTIVHYLVPAWPQFVYETSVTIRWLKEKKRMNCHVLTTSFLTRGLWENGREGSIPNYNPGTRHLISIL
jgi:hypothetical protein